MAGIDSLVNSRADMFAANPQGLQQRYAMGQDLLDLLALQKLKKDKEAAQRSLQMQMQPESGTVKDQLEGQMMQATKQELASSLAPGIQQQGQAMQAQQMQKAMAGGLPTQPAPNMVGMARGGIVGYAPGGEVEGEEDFVDPYVQALRKLLDVVPGPTDLIRGGLRALVPAGKAYREGSTLAGRGMAQAALARMPENAPGYQEAVAKLEATAPTTSTAPQVQAEPPTPTQPASAQPAPTPAGLEALVTPRTANRGLSAEDAAMRAEDARARQYQATDEDLASMLGEDLTPTRSVAAKDPRMSRYEDQLARLEAEEKDKLGALIDFLLAAGASGGTNLGATLMGGGSGLQAREQRIKDEMAQTIQNIETLQLEQQKMGQQESQFTRGLKSEERRDAAALRSLEGRTEADLAARAEQGRLDREVQQAISDAELSGRVSTDMTNRLTQQRLILADQYETIQDQLASGMVSDEQRDKLLAELDIVNAAMAELLAQLQSGASTQTNGSVSFFDLPE